MRTTIILLVILVVVLALALGWWAVQRDRTRRLRQRFGDEYDRTVERTGSRREAEQTLTETAQRRERLDIRPLSAQQREGWIQQWATVQGQFVDSPGEAVTMARDLLPALMRERGYPVEDFDQRAALLATDHPVVIGEYRAAEEAYQRHRAGGGSSTEALRQSLVHYRALFEALVDPHEGEPRSRPVDTARTDTARTDTVRTDTVRQDGRGEIPADTEVERTAATEVGGAHRDAVDVTETTTTTTRHPADAAADERADGTTREANR